MAAPSVADLVKVLHANIDSIHKTLSSLPDSTAHETHICSLENELENHLATLHKQHEDETQSLIELRQKHESELAEKRAREEQEILERRKREDEERRARLESEESERRRLIEDEDKHRAIQKQETETKKRGEVESEIERLEEEMEKKVEEGRMRLRDLDEERKSINARIDAILNIPTVFPEIKFRKRDRGKTLVNPPGEMNGSLVVGIKGLDLNDLKIEDPRKVDIPVHEEAPIPLAEDNAHPTENDVQDVPAEITGKVENDAITSKTDTDHALGTPPRDIEGPSIHPPNASTASISTSPESTDSNFIPAVETLSPFKEKVNVFDYQIPGSEAISIADPEEVMTEPAEDPEDLKARAEIAKLNEELFKTVAMEESVSEIPEEDGEMEISEDGSERSSFGVDEDSDSEDVVMEEEDEPTLRASELDLEAEADSVEDEPSEEVMVPESSQIINADTNIPISEEHETNSVLDADVFTSEIQSINKEEVHLDAAQTAEAKDSVPSSQVELVSGTENSEGPAEGKATIDLPADSHEDHIPARKADGSHEVETNSSAESLETTEDKADLKNSAMHGDHKNAQQDLSKNIFEASSHQSKPEEAVDGFSHSRSHIMDTDELRGDDNQIDSLDDSESDKENIDVLMHANTSQNIVKDESPRSFGAERKLDSPPEEHEIHQAPSEQGVSVERPATPNKKLRDMESMAESPATVLAADELFETDYEDDEDESFAETNPVEDDIAHQAFVKEASETLVSTIPVIETQNITPPDPTSEQILSVISPNEASSLDHDQHFEVSPQTGDETSPLGPAINITAATPDDDGSPDSPPSNYNYAKEIEGVMPEEEQEPLSGYWAGDSEEYSPDMEVQGKGVKTGIFAGVVDAVKGNVPLVRQMIGGENEGEYEDLPPVNFKKGLGAEIEHASVFDSDSESEQHFHESSEGPSSQQEEPLGAVPETSSSGSEDNDSNSDHSDSYRQNLPPAPTPPYISTQTGPTVPPFEYYANSEEESSLLSPPTTPVEASSLITSSVPHEPVIRSSWPASQPSEAEDPFQDPPELKTLSSPISPSSQFQALTPSFYDPSLNTPPTTHQKPPTHIEESPQSAASVPTSDRETFPPNPPGLSTRFLSDLQNAASPSSASPSPASNPSPYATPQATQSTLSTTDQSPLLYTNQPTPTPTPSSPTAISKPPFASSPTIFQKTRSLFETSPAPPSPPSNAKPRPTSAIFRSAPTSTTTSPRNFANTNTNPAPVVPTKRASLSSLWPGKVREGYGYGDEEEEVLVPRSLDAIPGPSSPSLGFVVGKEGGGKRDSFGGLESSIYNSLREYGDREPLLGAMSGKDDDAGDGY